MLTDLFVRSGGEQGAEDADAWSHNRFPSSERKLNHSSPMYRKLLGFRAICTSTSSIAVKSLWGAWSLLPAPLPGSRTSEHSEANEMAPRLQRLRMLTVYSYSILTSHDLISHIGSFGCLNEQTQVIGSPSISQRDENSSRNLRQPPYSEKSRRFWVASENEPSYFLRHGADGTWSSK